MIKIDLLSIDQAAGLNWGERVRREILAQRVDAIRRKYRQQHLAARLEDFDPDEPRDPYGKWAVGGAGLGLPREEDDPEKKKDWAAHVRKTLHRQIELALTVGGGALGASLGGIVGGILGSTVGALGGKQVTRLLGILERRDFTHAQAVHAVARELGVKLDDSLTDAQLEDRYQATRAVLMDAKAVFDAFDPDQPRDYHGRWSSGGELPPAPGTAPIPAGHVRLYHQAPEQSMGSIEQHGILLAKAKGIEGPRAIYAGETGFYGDPRSVPTVEFHVPKERWDAPFVRADRELDQGKVAAENIVAIHLPWHRHARYIEADPRVLAQVLAGEHDDLLPDTKHGPAIRYIKRTHDIGVKASGIEAADKIKAEWAAQTPIDSLDKLMQHGPGDQQALATAATEIQHHTGAEFINPGVKTRARTQEKIDGGRPAATITDVVRGGFKVTTPEQADAVVAGLAKRFTVADEGWAKTPVGYFDRKLMLKFASGIVGEVQLWHPDLLEAKEQRGGHEMYVQWSKAKKAGDAPRTKVLDEGMKALYKGVTDHLPAAWSGIVGK
jgi:hypothetical protein